MKKLVLLSLTAFVLTSCSSAMIRPNYGASKTVKYRHKDHSLLNTHGRK